MSPKIKAFFSFLGAMALLAACQGKVTGVTEAESNSCKDQFIVPWSNTVTREIFVTQGHSQGSHVGKSEFAYDFGLREKDPVTATAAGTVKFAQGGSSECGDEEFKEKTNYVVIDHGNNICSQYLHLSEVLVGVGQQVSAGQQIGTVGKTGWTDIDGTRGCRAHLHFQIQSCENVVAQSVPFCFSDVEGDGVLNRGDKLVSLHPMVAVQGMQVTQFDFSGVWEGNISFINFDDPPRQIQAIFDESSRSVTLTVEGREPLPSTVTLNEDHLTDQGYLCFTSSFLPEGWRKEIHYDFCFLSTSDGTIEFYGSTYGVGPAVSEEGTLHRIRK